MRKFVGFQITLFFLASRLKNISYSSYSQRKVVKAIDFMTPPRLPHTHTNTHTSVFKNLSDSKNVAPKRDLTKFFPNSVVNIAEII